jgi:hypothetical protein
MIGVGDNLGDSSSELGDSLGDSFDETVNIAFDLDDEIVAEFMPVADSPAEVEAELEEINFEGFTEIDPDRRSADTMEDADDIADALGEYGYSTEDLGKKPGEYEFKGWVAEETGMSKSDAGKAGHLARDGMEEIGWIPSSRSESKKT